MKITVKITPNATRSEIVGWLDEVLKIKIKAPAVDGKANQELIRFLAKWGAVRQSEIEIVRGITSKTKTLVVPDSLLAKLNS